MAKHQTHSIASKRQVAQAYLAGATLHGLARRHDLFRRRVRIWVGNYEAGAFDAAAEAASLVQEYKARIAALERLSGKQTLELESATGALRQGRSPHSVPISIITGPQACPSPKDAD